MKPLGRGSGSGRTPKNIWGRLVSKDFFSDFVGTDFSMFSDSI
jgi:hypothetical protein